jgi:hypothetical protein
MNRKTTNIIQNTTTGTTMTIVTGKHRELLIELLIYYKNKDNPNYIQLTDVFDDENPSGRRWVSAYIDEYES